MPVKTKAHADRITIIVRGQKSLIKYKRITGDSVRTDLTWLEFFHRKCDLRGTKNGEIMVKSTHYNVKRKTGWCVTDLTQPISDFLSKYKRPRNPLLVNISKVKVIDGVTLPSRNASVTAVASRRSQRLYEAKLNRKSVSVGTACTACGSGSASALKGSQSLASVGVSKKQPSNEQKPQTPCTSRSLTTPKKIPFTLTPYENRPGVLSLTTPKKTPPVKPVTKKTPSCTMGWIATEDRPGVPSVLSWFSDSCMNVETQKVVADKEYDVIIVSDSDDDDVSYASATVDEDDVVSLSEISIDSSVKGVKMMDAMNQGVRRESIKNRMIEDVRHRFTTECCLQVREQYHSLNTMESWTLCKSQVPLLSKMFDTLLRKD